MYRMRIQMMVALATGVLTAGPACSEMPEPRERAAVAGAAGQAGGADAASSSAAAGTAAAEDNPWRPASGGAGVSGAESGLGGEASGGDWPVTGGTAGSAPERPAAGAAGAAGSPSGGGSTRGGSTAVSGGSGSIRGGSAAVSGGSGGVGGGGPSLGGAEPLGGSSGVGTAGDESGAGIGRYQVGCASSDDCEADLGCLFHPAASWGACFPYCDSQSDCPSSTEPCVTVGEESRSYCMPNCDPREPQNGDPPFTACGPGAGCAVDGENAASYCTAESVAANEHGSFCEDSTDCAVGHTCRHRTCSRYCLVGGSDCDTLPRTACARLASVSTGATFGYCAGGQYAASDLPTPIPDLGTIGSSIVVPDELAISRVMVRVTVVHSYCSDLELTLYTPDGTGIQLSTGRGGMAVDCYSDTFFDDAAAVAIVAASPPFAGAYRPVQPLGGLRGADARGEWVLGVTDSTAGDTGELVLWELTIW